MAIDSDNLAIGEFCLTVFMIFFLFSINIQGLG
jgi:hypothetical protein